MSPELLSEVERLLLDAESLIARGISEGAYERMAEVCT